MVRFVVLRIHIFLKLQSDYMSSGQLALTLVQNWICKNEVIDVKSIIILGFRL